MCFVSVTRMKYDKTNTNDDAATQNFLPPKCFEGICQNTAMEIYSQKKSKLLSLYKWICFKSPDMSVCAIQVRKWTVCNGPLAIAQTARLNGQPEFGYFIFYSKYCTFGLLDIGIFFEKSYSPTRGSASVWVIATTRPQWIPPDTMACWRQRKNW